MKILILAILLSLGSRAVLADDPVYLPKSTPAPYSGYLVPEKTVTDMRNISLQLASEKTVNGLLLDEQAVMSQRINNAKTENDALAKELVSERDHSIFAKVGFFVLGAGVATLIAYGTIQATK
jgi:hypothetical protein